MLFPVKKKLVNWVDGMKISKDHLVQMEDHFIDAIRDSVNIHLNSYNFGLLPPYNGERSSSDFGIMEKITNHVEIELRRCNAITAGGCRININPGDASGYLKLDHLFENDPDESAKEEDLRWDVILLVKPFDRIPAGFPDPDETPPRYPDAQKAYSLFLTRAGQAHSLEYSAHNLVIGRVKKIGGRYEVDHNYIPPCISMSSHPELKSYYEQFGKYLNEIEVASLKIIQKIQERENMIEIAQNTRLICEQLLNHIAVVYFHYRNMGRNYAPIEIANTFSSLAHICYVSLNYISKKKREEMLQYYYEWSDVTPGSFMELISAMTELRYDHLNIRVIMEQIGYFLEVFSALWIKLSSLEYIGQHKENIVVAEKIQVVDQGPRKSGWTIID
ncbi:MAG: type VI secretion system baseplate subunit TssK [Tannerellaceae bacterium]|nr:type VI secretion system baseplate subunit TssK [Tannerellaceae bacterium]